MAKAMRLPTRAPRMNLTSGFLFSMSFCVTVWSEVVAKTAVFSEALPNVFNALFCGVCHLIDVPEERPAPSRSKISTIFTKSGACFYSNREATLSRHGLSPRGPIFSTPADHVTCVASPSGSRHNLGASDRCTCV